MKNGFFTCVMLIFLTACQPSSTLPVGNQLTQEEQQFVEQYQNILSKYLKDSDQVRLDKELENLTQNAPLSSVNPTVLHLKTDLYMQLGQFKQALQSNDELFYVEPSAENRYMRCTLYEVMQKPEKEVLNCYNQAAQLYKKAASKLKPNSLNFHEQDFFYHLSMLKAGHDNFDSKIKTLLDELPDELYEDYYEEYLSISHQTEHQALLQSIRDGKWMPLVQ